MKMLGLAAAVTATLFAPPVLAQTRVNPTPKPPSASPNYQATPVDPVFERLNKLEAEIKALRQSAGRQIVVLHFNDGQAQTYSSAGSSVDQTRIANICKYWLKDRYGRAISYNVDAGTGGLYYSQVVCETKP